jgi:REP element-mobilizing transposase RayT
MAFKPFDRDAERATYTRHLPHWQQPGCTYFVTFRLADSLPRARLDEWRAERDAWLKARGLRSVEELDHLPVRERRMFQQTFTRRMHEWLDAGYGSCLLREPRHALIMADALRFFDEKRCALGDFVVMPNHVHLLVTPFADWPLQTLLHTWKRFTAREINKLLRREGAVWLDESFDHVVRSSEQLSFFRQYIRENPVNAKLSPNEFLLGCGSDKESDAESGTAL